MNRYLILMCLILTLLGNYSCSEQKKNQPATPNKNVSTIENKTSENLSSKTVKTKAPSDFLPDGYVIFDKYFGDLNKDGVEDCVLIIKGTDKSKIIKDEYHGELDRNRRGLVVLFNKKGSYELVVKNYDCFSSENENGGVYYPPELTIEIEKGNLYIQYLHGRYGFWRYTFRYQNSDLELIGYNESNNRGPIINSEMSINFMTKKKIMRENVNEDPEQISGDEIFKESAKNMDIKKLIRLSEIKDFDELETLVL